MWEELAGLYYLWDVSWCMSWDFNITQFLSERLGESNISSAMKDFSEFIFDLDLLDLHLVGECIHLVQLSGLVEIR